MAVDDTLRPRYWEGQYLGAGDLRAEQDYGRSLRRRGNLAATTWGIVTGLELTPQPRVGEDVVDLVVTPGMAVDGFGREIVLFAPHKLAIEDFRGYPTEKWVQVWVRYWPESANPAPYGYEDCVTDQPYRTRETYRIAVGEFAPSHDPLVVSGRGVADSALPEDLSVPHQALSDDEERRRWLVPLGRAHWNGSTGFLAPATDEERTTAAGGRMWVGSVAATAWAPAGEWHLRSRGPTLPAPPAVRATVHGSLTAERVMVRKAGDPSLLRLDPGLLTLLPANEDAKVPLTVARAEAAAGADLRIQLGQESAPDTRLVVYSAAAYAAAANRLVVTAAGDTSISGGLSVKKVLDLTGDTGDRVLFDGAAGQGATAAVGLEPSGSQLFARAQSGMLWYAGSVSGDIDNARMNLHRTGLQVRGDLVVGWGNNGKVRVRHVDGKRADSDLPDTLYLNFDNGQDVHVGNVNGTRSDLHVSGRIFLGQNQLQLKMPIDVVVGHVFHTFAGKAGTTVAGSHDFQVTSNLPQANTLPQITVALAGISNRGTAVNASWRLKAFARQRINERTWEFRVNWEVADDGSIDGFSYVVVFFP